MSSITFVNVNLGARQIRPSRFVELMSLVLLGMVNVWPQVAPATAPKNAAHDGRHDFDFEIGTWRTDLKRLSKPLTGSNDWVECHGITVVRKVWNGRANLVELTADCPGGSHFEGLNLRLYNPESHQWSLNFANARSGALGTPTMANFTKGEVIFTTRKPMTDAQFSFTSPSPGLA